jgi:hypothetical protein
MNKATMKIREVERLNFITQRIGSALLCIQALEECVAIVFVLMTKAQRGMGVAAGTELVEKQKSLTFGRTISQIRVAGLFSNEIESRFTKLKDERNWLVHSSRASCDEAIHNMEACTVLIDRLRRISDEGRRLLHESQRIAERHTQDLGISDQQIKSAADELLGQWTNS